MKILLISPTQTGIGGIAQHIQNLSKFLKKNGHYVEIISSENTLTIPIKGLKNPSFMFSSYIKSKFKKNFDIIHAHNIPAALAMKNFSGKKILTIHGIYSDQIRQLHGKAKGKILEKIELKALSLADVITVVSNEALIHYSKNTKNIFQIPNGINSKFSNYNDDVRFTNQIIFVGRLSKEKGIDTLIKIAKKLPLEINLIIIGQGPEKEKISKLSQKENIHYFGQKNHEETISLIKGSKILIQPSFSEGISSTILEAMVCKTAVIASNVGGNSELIKNNQSGFLIDPYDDETFVSKIIQLLEDTSLRDKFSNIGFLDSKKFDWDVVGEKYLDLYQSLFRL